MGNVRLPAEWLRVELAAATAETAKWPLWKRKACGLEPLDEADRLANGDLGRGNLIRAYGEACRRAGADAAVQVCGSCDGRWPNDECPHAKNAAYATEPSPCHPRAAEAASPAAGWNHLAEIERILSKDLDASDRLDEIEAVITQALHRPAPSEEATAG